MSQSFNPAELASMRAQFAAAAIPAVMATPWYQHTSSQRGSSEYASELADECFAIADEMIKKMIEGPEA